MTLDGWYAEGRRLNAIADAEHAARPALGPFTLSAAVVPWCEQLAQACALVDATFSSDTAARWWEALPAAGLERSHLRKAAYVADVLLSAAVTDGIVQQPEPGELRMSFAHRDEQTEAEVAWGWGFSPAATVALVYFARRSLTERELSAGARAGGDAIHHVLATVLDSMANVRRGPVDRRH